MQLRLGDVSFDITHEAIVMGILNRTPDSFYDRGSYWDIDSFLAKAEALVEQGADVLDVGGVKAGPGDHVSLDEELQRVVPAIEMLRARFDVPLSVDTWNAEVLRESLGAGAVVANDISGFADPLYLKVAAEAEASVVATHIRLGPRIPDPEPVYRDLVGEVVGFLAERAASAEEVGIPRDRIMIDAGLDLGKTEPQSMVLLSASQRLADLGYPLLLSASNKRFLGELFGLDIADRSEMNGAAHALGIARGCRILRAHDVRAAKQTASFMALALEAY
ncbi:MAG: dihydropteroate synthase [Acidimicrobiales bacterium]